MKRRHIAILIALLLAAASAMAAHAVCSGSGTITEPCLTIYRIDKYGPQKLLHVSGEATVYRDIFGNLIIRPKENITAIFYDDLVPRKMQLDADDTIVLHSNGYQGFVVERYAVTAWFLADSEK